MQCRYARRKRAVKILSTKFEILSNLKYQNTKFKTDFGVLNIRILELFPLSGILVNGIKSKI